VLHEGGGGLVAQEGADQVDVNHLGEELARHRPVLAKHPPGADHSGAVHQQVEPAEARVRAIHGRVDLGLGGDIAAHEKGVRTQRRGRGSPGSLLHVEDDDAAALVSDVARDRVAEARGAAGDHGACVLDLHVTP